MVYTDQTAGYIALLMFLAGCALLHMRLRRTESLSLLLSVAAVIVLGFWAQAAVERVLFDLPSNAHIASVARRYNVLATFEALLMLWFGASFLLAIKRVPLQARA